MIRYERAKSKNLIRRNIWAEESDMLSVHAKRRRNRRRNVCRKLRQTEAGLKDVPNEENDENIAGQDQGGKDAAFLSMLELLKEEADRCFTENGAAAYSSSGSYLLDLFATSGAIRRETELEITRRFVRAFMEDRDTAMKLLFYTRDIRGGLGERKVFRTALRWLAMEEPESVVKNIKLIPEYGRYDDLFVLMGTPCEEDMLKFVKEVFWTDMANVKNGGAVSLLAKWMPSINTASEEVREKAKIIARFLGLNAASYRKALSTLRRSIRIIENNLRKKDYSFDYGKQPSRAMFKYRQAFIRNDGERYQDFLSKVGRGDAVMHADNVSPYEIVQPFLRIWRDDVEFFYESDSFVRDVSNEEKLSLNATWSALPDFGGDDDTLAVIDTSGSMYMYAKPTPAAVALSLGLYFAEHNKGAFRRHFIEFSSEPTLIELKGRTFADRLRFAGTFCQAANTNIEAVFDLVLKTAVKNRVPQSEIPKRLLIVSDMEFDAVVHNADETNFENARRRFQEAGYELPEVVFWNVASRRMQQPVKMNEQGVALLSGCTPRLFSMVASAKKLSPYAFMMDVLESERYVGITA